MISIAMPTYNGEKYLRSQLDSIYAQTMAPDEVVVVDDCSKDGTVEILKDYKKKYGLKYYVNEKNLGYNRNFEKAISLCSGDYIALSDQDDVWFPNKIEVCYNAIIKFPIDKPSLVSSFVEQVDAYLKPIRKDLAKIQEGDWRLNLTRYNAQGCTLMFNRALLNLILPFPEDMIYDAYIGLTASMVGNRYYIPQKLQYYRLYGGNSLANDKPKAQYALSTQKHLLNAYVPYWYTKDSQYRFLKLLKKYQGNNFILERVSTLEKVIRIFEVGKLKRLFLFLSLDGPNAYMKLRVSIGLILKTIFFINDEY